MYTVKQSVWNIIFQGTINIATLISNRKFGTNGKLMILTTRIHQVFNLLSCNEVKFTANLRSLLDVLKKLLNFWIRFARFYGKKLKILQISRKNQFLNSVDRGRLTGNAFCCISQWFKHEATSVISFAKFHHSLQMLGVELQENWSRELINLLIAD